MEENEELSKPTAAVNVHRYSWWKTPDGKRLMVVVGIYHQQVGTSWVPKSYDLLDVSEQTPKCIENSVFRNLVQAGRLVQVIREKDIPSLEL